MAALAKSGTPSLASSTPPAPHCITGLLVGEDIAAGDACYIKNDGKIWRSVGSGSVSAGVASAGDVHGYAPIPAKVAQNDALTLLHGVVFNYGSGLTPGAKYYLSGSAAGGLDTAPSTNVTLSCGFAIDTTRIFLKQAINN